MFLIVSIYILGEIKTKPWVFNKAKFSILITKTGLDEFQSEDILTQIFADYFPDCVSR